MFDLQTLKKDSFSEALMRSIPICDLGGDEIGKLIPIGNWALDDAHLLQSFSSWRKTFMRFFLTQFEASEQSTAVYLKNQSIKQHNRIFFGIYLDNNLIGHIGLSDIVTDQAEIDNLIRGKSGGHTDLIYFAEKTLLEWAFQNLKIDKIVGRILSKNFMAMSVHERCGFSLKERFPLKKVTRDDAFSFEQCTSEAATEKFFLDIIEVTKTKFFESIVSV